MARKFTVKPSLGVAAIPGAGVVTKGVVIEGDEYARFCPGKLVEVFGTSVSKVVPAPKPEPEPKPKPEPEPEPETAERFDGAPVPEPEVKPKRRRGRPRKNQEE